MLKKFMQEFVRDGFDTAMSNMNKQLEAQGATQVWRGDYYDDGEKRWVPSSVRPLQPPKGLK